MQYTPSRTQRWPLSRGAWRWAVALGWCATAACAQAQVAVPFYTAPQWMQSLDRHWWVPRAQAFEQASQRLSEALSSPCDAQRLQQAQGAWSEAVTAWEGLSAVTLGPLITRRSGRRIDFQPTRIPMIERAMSSPPADLKGLESVGAPAKGLPALEWLLWQGTDPAAACTYARVLAAEVLDEAVALRSAFEQRAAGSPHADGGDADEAVVTAQAAEFVNQWVGGLESLRWHHLGKPVESAQASQGKPKFARPLSGHTAQTWASTWAALRDIARSPQPKRVGSSTDIPAAVTPMSGLVPLSLYLKGRGLMALAQRLDDAVARVDRDMARVRVNRPASLKPAVKSLGALRTLVETDVATALKVNIGFSDADGD